MQVKVKMILPGYPSLQEKWITIEIDEDQNPEVRRAKAAGFHLVKAEVSL
jgi:hypothetical protein